MVRNNLTVCHHGMLLPARVEEVCRKLYQVCFFKSAFVSVSVSAQSVCWHVHAHVPGGTTLFVVGGQSLIMHFLVSLEVDKGRNTRIEYQGRKPS